jgi:hypothetical protein
LRAVRKESAEEHGAFEGAKSDRLGLARTIGADRGKRFGGTRRVDDQTAACRFAVAVDEGCTLPSRRFKP